MSIEIIKGTDGVGSSEAGSYSDLTNKPQINGVTLSGNKSGVDLGLTPATVTISDASVTISEIQANKNYVLSNNAITDITLTACETSMEETTIQFTTGSNAPTLTDNSGLVWFDGIPTLLPNTTYVIVIFNKQAFYQEN